MIYFILQITMIWVLNWSGLSVGLSSTLASITVILAMILDELAKINRKLSKPEV